VFHTWHDPARNNPSPSRWASACPNGGRARASSGHDDAYDLAEEGYGSESEPRSLARHSRNLLGVVGVIALAVTVFLWPRVEQQLALHLDPVSGLNAMEAAQPGHVNLVRFGHSKSERRSQAPEDRVIIARAPATMSPLLAQRIRSLVAELAGDDPLDQASLQVAHTALSQSPWVRQVYQLRRGSAGRIIVHAAFREPVAVVLALDGYHLVDAEGVRLPGVYRADQLNYLALPVITGVTHAPPPEGAVWPGDELQAGLDLAQLIEGEGYAPQVASYDVSDRDALGRLRLRLITERGMVRWGLPPGDERGLEPTSATKLRWLSSVNRRRGSIDAGGKVVDVYGAAVYVYDWASASDRPVAAR